MLTFLEAEALKAEVNSLRQWKYEAIAVMPDFQTIGRLLGLKLGQSVHDKIVPGIVKLKEENERLRQKVLSAAGDDLCRLTQEEIKAMSLGLVKIPPKEEFIASCERFHAQVAKETGVLQGGKTIAQLEAENEQLRAGLIRIRDTWPARYSVYDYARETARRALDGTLDLKVEGV